MSPRNISFYTQRALDFMTEFQRLNQKARTISFFRIITFIGFLIFFVSAANRGNLAMLILSIILFIIIFGLLVNKHNQVKYLSKQNGFMSQINEEEI
jgi:hypothetical protein